MILSFLSLAVIPLMILVALTSLTMSDQRNKLIEQLEGISERGSSNLPALEDDEIAQWVAEGIQTYNISLASARVKLFFWSFLLIIVIAGTGWWLSKRLASPFEVAAMTASRLLQGIQGIVNNVVPAPRSDEAYLLQHTLNTMETQVKDEILGLKETISLQSGKLIEITSKLQEVVQIGKSSALTIDVEQMLSEAAQAIAEKFGFSHVGLYLVDESRQYVELKAADQQPGSQKMLRAKFRLKVGSEGIPGFVAATGEPYQAAELSQDVHALPNPEFSLARSEAAFPLQTRTAVIGVLDILSTTPAQFASENMVIFQIVANQLALAVENARLFEQTLQALDAERRAFGEMTRLAWDEMIRNRPDWGYRSEEQGVHRVEGGWLPWMVQAAQKGQTVLWQANGFSIASVPIRVRDHILGVLDFRKEGETSSWMTEDLTLVQTLTDQLGQALESARLYQNTQLRAERERLLAEITSKVRASTNVNVILQTAVRELAEALQVPKGAIQLRGASGNNLADGGKSNA
jgi:GAF domain-containing protein